MEINKSVIEQANPNLTKQALPIHQFNFLYSTTCFPLGHANLMTMKPVIVAIVMFSSTSSYATSRSFDMQDDTAMAGPNKNTDVINAHDDDGKLDVARILKKRSSTSAENSDANEAHEDKLKVARVWKKRSSTSADINASHKP